MCNENEAIPTACDLMTSLLQLTIEPDDKEKIMFF